MLDIKVVELLNQQVNKEFYSAYLYLDFSNYYYDKGLDGFGNWYRIQAQEERDHAMLFVQYLQNNGEKIELEAIAKPGVELVSAKAVLEEYGRILADGINSLNHIFQPEMIVVSGGIANQGKALLNLIEPYLLPDTEVATTTLNGEGGIIGAALLGTEYNV